MSMLRPKQKQAGAAELFRDYKKGNIGRTACHAAAVQREKELAKKLEGKDPESARYDVLRRERWRYERIASYTEPIDAKV